MSSGNRDFNDDRRSGTIMEAVAMMILEVMIIFPEITKLLSLKLPIIR